jgi:hypothetical protein
MKKIFIGQAVSGEDMEKLKVECSKIQEKLTELGYGAYCTVHPRDEKEEKSPKDWMMHAFEEIDNSEMFLGIVRSEKRSEGMLMEVGYCLSKKKKLVIAVNKDVKDKTYLDEMADVVIEFEDIDDLINKLDKLKE